LKRERYFIRREEILHISLGANSSWFTEFSTYEYADRHFGNTSKNSFDIKNAGELKTSLHERCASKCK